jgi:hypothetical protein
MSKATRGSILALIAAVALAGCHRNAAQNAQANMAGGPPDMASDTGMNAAATGDMTNAGTSTDVSTTTTSNTSGY